MYCIVLYCIMRPYTEGRLDRYRVGIPRELSEIRTQPWLSEGSLTCDSCPTCPCPDPTHLIVIKAPIIIMLYYNIIHYATIIIIAICGMYITVCDHYVVCRIDNTVHLDLWTSCP